MTFIFHIFAMQISYKTRKLEKSVENAKAIVKNYGTRAKLVKQRLEELKAAPNLSDFRKMPQTNCHELKGDRKGQLAIDISANHRIIFVPDNEQTNKEDGGLDWSKITKIRIIAIGEDYH